MDSLINLPLFPLRSVVVPFMELPLHIFEERYKQLLRDCLAGDRRFGVLLIREGAEVGGSAEPYGVGTVVEITEAQELPTGGFKIVAMGRQRFRVTQLWRDRPYLRCHGETLPELTGDLEAARAFDGQVRLLTAEYVAAVYTMMGEDGRRPVGLPDDSLTLSYAVVMLLSVHMVEAQALLEAPTVTERLALEDDLLRRELAILRQMRQGRPRLPKTDNPRYSPN